MTQKKKDTAATALAYWKAKENNDFPRDLRFLIIASLILFLLVAYGLFINNLLMSVLFILIGFALYLIKNKGPETAVFAITQDGIVDKDHLYKFNSLKSFWINYEPGKKKEIILKSKTNFLPYIKIPLGNQSPLKIRKILINFLPEEEHRDPIGDFMGKFF
ncbi:MAG: hypothetical protein R6V40_01960 [Candidatus Moraniibacteriota bacterium]